MIFTYKTISNNNELWTMLFLDGQPYDCAPQRGWNSELEHAKHMGQHLTMGNWHETYSFYT